MECMQAAELTRHELAHEGGLDSSVTPEDLFVDELLDLQNVEFEDGGFRGKDEEEEDEDEAAKFCLRFDIENPNYSGDFSESTLASDLAFPEDDETAGLEWVSRFVDDSPSEFCFPSALPVKRMEPEPEPEPEPKSDQANASLLVFTRKPRTKRSRRSSVSQLSESSSSSSSSSSSCSSHFFVFPGSPVRVVQIGEPERKKQKRKPAVQPGPQFMRRCSHCQVQKTPQWRTGPNGAKTLCNACGVRFKSGRLFPEYRPACSPTFSSEVHSNSHRKVLEMRKKKDGPGPGQPGPGLARAITSF